MDPHQPTCTPPLHLCRRYVPWWRWEQEAAAWAAGDGFDGFGTTDPPNQNDDDQINLHAAKQRRLMAILVAKEYDYPPHLHFGFGTSDQGEPDAPDAENPNEDTNMVTDDPVDGSDDDSWGEWDGEEGEEDPPPTSYVEYFRQHYAGGHHAVALNLAKIGEGY